MTHKPLSKFVLFWKSLKDKLTVDPKHVYPLICFQWGCSENSDKPDLTSFWWQFGRGPKDYSLYHNGIVFIRLTWSWRHVFPLCVFWHIRWSGKPNKKAFFQYGFGPKVNGQLSLVRRFQSDESGADGTYGGNTGQSSGWQCGSK